MTWSDYMRTYGYREYPCKEHARPFCEECYGPDPRAIGTETVQSPEKILVESGSDRDNVGK